jgi:hypothetical protein
MLKILTILCCLIVISTSAQTANSKDNWEITIKSDTATYQLKLIADIDIHGYGVKLKRDNTAKFHKLEVPPGGTQTDVILYNADTDKEIGALRFWAGEDPLPYFDISSLKPGKYMLHMLACNNGGFIQFDLE